jgi:archaellum component FlaC
VLQSEAQHSKPLATRGLCEVHNRERYTIHVSKSYTNDLKLEERENNLSRVIPAVGKLLKPIKEDLTTIKGQLDGISKSIDDLTERIEEIEEILKASKAKGKKAKVTP